MSRQMKHYNFPIRNFDGTFYVQVHPFDPEYFAVKVHPTWGPPFHTSSLTVHIAAAHHCPISIFETTGTVPLRCS